MSLPSDIPVDVLREVFSDTVRENWRNNPTEEIIFRLNVLCACGPRPSESLRRSELVARRAQKAAWETYLITAFACGMFEGNRGADLRSRLQSKNPENFRAAMAECLACWFFAGSLKMSVSGTAVGSNRKNLDLCLSINNKEIGIEVKSPFREAPEAGGWWGDESDKLREAIDAANKQFDDSKPNLLVLVPVLRTRICPERDDAVKAAFGETKITFQIDPKTGGAVNEPQNTFFPTGKFLNTTGPKGKSLKSDGLPAYRRISAILCIEERLVHKYEFPNPLLLENEETRSELWPLFERARDLYFSHENEARIDHDVLVIHNPHAYHPFQQDVWKDYPQFVLIDNAMKWTDGHPVHI